MSQVLSDFDIFSVVGANKPVQLVDLRVSVKEDRVLVMRFEGVVGSPAISGIGIRRAPNTSGIFVGLLSIILIVFYETKNLYLIPTMIFLLIMLQFDNSSATE